MLNSFLFNILNFNIKRLLFKKKNKRVDCRKCSCLIV